jgi:dipeptide/tripeptide permease
MSVGDRMEGCRGVGSVKNAGSSCTKQILKKEETLIYFTLFYHGVALPSFAQSALCPSWQQRQALNGALEVAASLCLT